MEENLYYIISDQTLNHFHCSVCQNYLSIGPIVIEDTKFICGRCHQGPVDDMITLPEGDLNTKLFRCIHRYNGCRALLKYTDTENHEKTCLKACTFQCVICQYSGNGCQIHYHYLQKHSDIVQENSLFLKVNFEKSPTNLYNLVCKGDYLFLMKTTTDDHNLQVQVMNYGSLNFNLAEYTINLKSFGRASWEYKTAAFPCISKYSFDDLLMHPKSIFFINIEGIIDKFKISDSDPVILQIDFITMNNKSVCISLPVNPSTSGINQEITDKSSAVSNHDISKEIEELHNRNQRLSQLVDNLSEKIWPLLFKCSNCEAYLSNVLRWCENHHLRCEECFSEYCHVCNQATKYKFVTDGRHNLLKLLKLPCRWYCLGVFEPDKLRKHEFKCADRKYGCPVPLCKWKGDLDSLINHWHSSVPMVHNTCQINSFDGEEKSFYVFDCKDYFLVHFGSVENGNRSLRVEKTSKLSYNVADLYAIIDIQIMDSVTKVFNSKLYMLNFERSYSLKVPSKLYYELYIKFTDKMPEGVKHYLEE